MEHLWTQHKNFLKQAYRSCKFGNEPYSALPSTIFLCGAFSLLYFHLHPHTSLTWTRFIYKNIMFHWIFFYVLRMWLMFVKLVKYFNSLLDEILKGGTPDDDLILCRALVHSLLFLTVLTVSMTPLLILRLFIIYNRQVAIIVDWEEGNRWDGNEIGSSGHYLTRPPDVNRRSRKFPRAYRSKRSMSFDNHFEFREQEVALRGCKSLADICSSHKLENNG